MNLLTSLRQVNDIYMLALISIWSKSVIFCINIFCNNRKLYAVGHAFRQRVSFFKQNDLHTHLSKCRWIIQKTINLIINTCVIQTWVVVKSSSTPGINGSIFQWVSWPKTPMIFPVIKNKKRATDSVWIFKVVLSLLSSINQLANSIFDWMWSSQADFYCWGN